MRFVGWQDVGVSPRCLGIMPHALVAGKGAADSTPWWGRYKAEFLRMLSFGELETYDHPVACARAPASPEM